MPSINQHPDIDSSGPIVDGLPPLPGVDSASKSTAAATSASSASEGFWYTMVIPPKPASAAARRAWDLSFRYSRDIALPQRLEAAHPSVSEQLARNSPDILKEEEQDPTVGVSPALSGSASQTSMPQQRGTYGHRGRRPFGMTHALASRVEDDYPLGTYTRVQPSSAYLSPYAPTGLGASPECELYTMHIDVNGTPLGAPGARLDLAFRVMLDTGSNTTWLLGHNYCGAVKVAEAPQINQQQEPAGSEAHNRQNTHQHSAEGSESRAANHPNPATHRPEEPSTGHVGVQRAPSAPLGSRPQGTSFHMYKLVDGTDSSGCSRPQHRTLPTACISRNPATGLPVITEGTIARSVSYADGTHAVVAVPNDRYEVRLLNSYRWTATASVPATDPHVDIVFRFAVAYAVSYNIDRNPCDGLLALGPSKMQRELTDRPWHRQDDLGYTYSFTEILRQTFPPSSNAADGSSGHGLYFALRSPTYPFYYIQEHWISYNACPIKVQWSKDIPLSPPTGLDGDYKRWAVALTSMNIVKVESAGRTVVIPGGELFQSSHGTGEVLFDTGSSLTYVPDHVIEHLRTVTFKCPENGENENEQGHVTRDEDRPAFVVPDRLVSPTEGLWIELVFVGMAEQPVKVYVLMDPFLCARNPTSPGTSREGLWCSGQSLPRPLKPTEMIFGLNFFQAAYVALLWPHAPRKPCVRLAGQAIFAANMEEHKLPRFQN